MSQQATLLALAGLYSFVAISAQLCVPFAEMPMWLAQCISWPCTLGCFAMWWASMPVAKEPRP
jgi:hypothetical protein